MESVIATNFPTPDSSSFEKPTPTPAVLKKRLRLPTPAVLKTDSDSSWNHATPPTPTLQPWFLVRFLWNFHTSFYIATYCFILSIAIYKKYDNFAWTIPLIIYITFCHVARWVFSMMFHDKILLYSYIIIPK